MSCRVPTQNGYKSNAPCSHFVIRPCLLYHHHLRFEWFCELAPSPTFVATVGPHPSHPTMTVFAKISPKPSITPFTNGKNMLMDNEENKAQIRVRGGSVWSNIERVTDAVVAGRVEAAPVVIVVVAIVVARGAGECGREGSGNDMEGKDDVGESTHSHGGESDGSPVLACWPAGGAVRVGGAFELVDRGKFCCEGGPPSCCACEGALPLAPPLAPALGTSTLALC